MERLIALYNTASPSGNEKSMMRLIRTELERMGVRFTRDKTGNIYATKGNAKTYPCIIAHTDEVHHRKSGTYSAHIVDGSFVVGYDQRKKRITGIGADDKNGIWICLKCLEDFKVMKCAFFVREETGCIGSNSADMAFFTDCRFVLQCDRKGNGDLVTRVAGQELCSDKFLAGITPEKYGYEVTTGKHTDVYALKRKGLSVSCVNISCGYYELHTNHEYTVLDDLYKCYRFVRHIIRHHKETSRHKPATERRPVPEYYGLYPWNGYTREDFARYRRALRTDMDEKAKGTDKKSFI